ncbi:branched-chain amino acid transport system II carrier protein [Virgibacillus sediminis]|uniref:Branched-chain amino acid transport system carrier protein n=1 Tax=Virgibacillus sediminis TaxID=202260 RepID=A0ABV7A7A6_9BACI
MRKDIFTIGFMLFALFFGAGNLIYPPVLGMEAGTAYWPAITGFILTGVGLPILAVTAISFVKNDARELADRVHPLFGLLFTSTVYLAIGAFFGIPRAATVGYEMSVHPFTEGASNTPLIIFTVVFFSLVYLVSLNPSRMVDRIGQYLTPILLIAIVGLSIGALLLFDNPAASPKGDYGSTPLFTGFLEGYLTMDAIAALAFGIIVVNAFKDRGYDSPKQLVSATLKAGIVAGIGLILVYSVLGWIGSKMALHGSFTNGGNILSHAADMIFGSFGTLLLGVIVALACFTTSVGLVVASGQFFVKVTPLSYKWIISIVTLASFLIANQGLETIISISVPVLTFIYPIAIVLILLTFMDKLFGGRRGVYRGAILLTAIISLYDGLTAFGLELDQVGRILQLLPFFSIGLGWLLPAVIGGLAGFFLSGKEESTPDRFAR